MAEQTTDSSSPAASPLAPKKEDIAPANPKLAELNESRVQLLNRIQNLKQDLQGWRSKLDTQVKVYREEMTELKTSLNLEVEQLRNEFKELKNTLHQQQEDVAASLNNLVLRDDSEDAKEQKDEKAEGKDDDVVKEAEH
ncbi:PREDICTED: CAP-Gly domain-containing linker protein 1-like [Tarenaya hassleriana]|uniref:CAP-Gly domain-containing linker protein 1-like n=1 Tax=Tarenaya hassleriana TaxID=28532 RepID=UPI00053C3D23|nr:PREDICTED: CAP-Gly domain-containing linker protein 1-like [Tarenaya hassleriana]